MVWLMLVSNMVCAMMVCLMMWEQGQVVLAWGGRGVGRLVCVLMCVLVCVLMCKCRTPCSEWPVCSCLLCCHRPTATCTPTHTYIRSSVRTPACTPTRACSACSAWERTAGGRAAAVQIRTQRRGLVGMGSI